MSQPAIVSGDDCSSRDDLLAPPSPLDVLELRCWARAYLFSIGELELHEAVDVLQADADRDGIDQDTVQKILAREFGRYREADQ